MSLRRGVCNVQKRCRPCHFLRLIKTQLVCLQTTHLRLQWLLLNHNKNKCWRAFKFHLRNQKRLTSFLVHSFVKSSTPLRPQRVHLRGAIQMKRRSPFAVRNSISRPCRPPSDNSQKRNSTLRNKLTKTYSRKKLENLKIKCPPKLRKRL